MPSVAPKIMATVNAPFGASLTSAQLAARISDIRSVAEHDHLVFAFLSDVSPKLQHAFIAEMGVNLGKVKTVADGFSELAGYKLALAH